jgi:hypothetical protein
MTEILYNGAAFLDETLRGVVYRRNFEVYVNDGASCGAVVLGEGVNLESYPLLIASVRVPGGDAIRVEATWIRQIAPAVIEVTISRQVIEAPFAAGESSLLFSLVAADAAGNEEPIIVDGQLVILQGGL